MRSHLVIWILGLAGLLWSVDAGHSQVVQQDSRLLFTPQEAEQLRLTDEEWKPSIYSRDLPSGPHIVIKRPEFKHSKAGFVLDATSPADLFVVFEQTRAPVDMDSLQIKAKKGIFSKSLTARLRPYIEGNSLRAKQIKIPSGRFRIQIAIADRQGEKTVETYRLVVRR